MKKILFVSSEAVPFIKTGGLADVAGTLPKSFNKDEFDVRVVIPKYRAIPEHYRNQMYTGPIFIWILLERTVMSV